MGGDFFQKLDLNSLAGFKKQIRKNGKRFNDTVLIPVVQKNRHL
jgi:hypothetical protein